MWPASAWRLRLARRARRAQVGVEGVDQLPRRLLRERRAQLVGRILHHRDHLALLRALLRRGMQAIGDERDRADRNDPSGPGDSPRTHAGRIPVEMRPWARRLLVQGMPRRHLFDNGYPVTNATLIAD